MIYMLIYMMMPHHSHHFHVCSSFLLVHHMISCIDKVVIMIDMLTGSRHDDQYAIVCYYLDMIDSDAAVIICYTVYV